MADSKLSNTDKDFALITAAMAYRVKYRIDEKKYRFELGIKRMGSHPKNRGTVYPSGLRCKTLLWTVGKSGFLKEEVNHACVVVGALAYVLGLVCSLHCGACSPCGRFRGGCRWTERPPFPPATGRWLGP